LLSNSLLKPVEEIINRGIRRSTTAANLCQSLEKKRLAINVTGTGLRIGLTAQSNRIKLDQASDRSADAEITGSPLALARMAKADVQTPIREGAVEIEGDTDTAERFSELLRLTFPDLEEELSKLVGDAAAHQAGSAGRALRKWIGNATRTFNRSLGEFVQEERRVLPTRIEVNEFMAEVDAVANDFARLEAGIEHLNRNIAQSRDS
jgi:ubiquinone biosynthesis protein UbiJ